MNIGSGGLVAATYFVALTMPNTQAMPRVNAGIAFSAPAITLVASKKKSGSASAKSTADPYQRAWALCRRKYGDSNVARVRIRSDGKIMCYLRFYSPNE